MNILPELENWDAVRFKIKCLMNAGKIKDMPITCRDNTIPGDSKAVAYWCIRWKETERREYRKMFTNFETAILYWNSIHYYLEKEFKPMYKKDLTPKE